MMQRAVLSVLLVLCLFGITGCAGYEPLVRWYTGPELSESEVCYLVKPFPYRITYLDGKGKKTKNWLEGGNCLFHRSYAIIELKPGPHKVSIIIHESEYRSNGIESTVTTWYTKGEVPLSFTGQAGRIYSIKPSGDMLNQYYIGKFWIEDITDSKRANESTLPYIRRLKAQGKASKCPWEN